MMRIIFLCGVIMLWLAATAQASITDAPHTDCTPCHRHAKGFKGDGHDNFSFAWAGNCATCHNPGGEEVNITTVIHGGKCGLCHENTAGGGVRRDGDPTNGIDGSALGATNSSTCVDCHLGKLHLTAGAIHHDSAHGYAAAGNCSQCHEDAPGKLAAPHDTVVTPATECSSCHTATAGLVTGMPVSGTGNKAHDACVTCHDTDGSLKAAYGRTIAIKSGSCTTCHGLMRSSLHENISDCTKCHAGFYDPVALDTTREVGKHQKHYTDYQLACSTCHFKYPARQTHMDGTMNVSDPAVPIVFFSPANAMAQWNGTTGTCSATYCHSDGTALATGVAPTNPSPSWNTGRTTCTSCHYYQPLYAQDSPKSNSHAAHAPFNPTCNYCHAATTMNGTSITNRANHANGTYNVAPDTSAIFEWGGTQAPVPVNFTYIYDAGGGRCSNISCHAAMGFGDKSWGDFSLELNSSWSHGPACYEIRFSSAVANGTPPYTYSWDFGDGTTSAEQNPDHVFQPNATYSVTLVAKDAKNHPATKVVRITPQPSANTFPVANNSASVHGYTVTLTDLSHDSDYNTCGRSGTGQMAILWGDGPPNTVDNAFPLTGAPSNRAYSHTYTTAGNYIIWESIIDNSGAQIFISKPITVPPPPAVDGRLTHEGSGVSGARREL